METIKGQEEKEDTAAVGGQVNTEHGADAYLTAGENRDAIDAVLRSEIATREVQP